MYLYRIYSANNCGVLFSWGVSVCPSGTGLRHVHFLRYVFVLDIFCQQLWDVVHLVGCLCALRAQGWVMYNIRDNCNIRRTSTRRTSARPFLMLSEIWGNLSSLALVLLALVLLALVLLALVLLALVCLALVKG